MPLLFFLVISLGIQILLFIPAFLLKTDKSTSLLIPWRPKNDS